MDRYFLLPDGTISVEEAPVGLPEGWIELDPPPAREGWRWSGGPDGSWVPVIPSMPAERLWQLMTLPEHVAARATGDATLAVAFDRINARRAPLPLDDTNFVALVWRLVDLAVLSVPRAMQAMAGQFPAEGG